jgi:hypothetical protein
MELRSIIPGMVVFAKKRTRWHEARVVATYKQPPAIRIKFGIGDEWIVKPEEVLTLGEKELAEKAERNAQAQ